ncbi:MAG: leucine--tRNA ligase [Fimbriimonas sp.]|nr:leucine--tRNA ligase [Fimbriimonas sp.]
MADRYEPASFEAAWQKRWKNAELFKTRTADDAPKFYGMDFFPYPSGAGLSVGHCRNYVPTDVICRMKVMQGYNVLHPMGFDAFGLPAENEAIKNKTHPAKMIERYAGTYRRQMELIGVSYDWSRSFSSSDPSYYKWTQWIFELMFKKGLAYRRLAAVNWDPIDKTVLADEEIIGGRAERSGAIVEKKWIPQWFFKITDYAQRLLDDLDELNWPEGIKSQQRNWIGRSEGVQFSMKVADSVKPATPVDDDFQVRSTKGSLAFEVFTTRIDTVFGMTFCVLAPEHPLIDSLVGVVGPVFTRRIREYQENAKTLSDTDRQATNREKTGVFTGAYAVNPANGAKVPIWIADYVLSTYGTGAIMAVPGHDERDYEFARKFGIDIVQVIAPSDKSEVKLPYVAKDGILVNSGEYDDMPVVESQTQLGIWMEGLGIGQRKVQFRLRDWLISRQRYWGCPIPIIHTKDGEMQLVLADCLPVELPVVENYEPSGDGSSPLAHIQDFVNVTDLDGRLGHRETDTMGGFACSSWYFLRFCDPMNDKEAWSIKLANYWMPVDCYVGGSEHAVMHLLYARFWTKVLYDAGLVAVKEPFARLENQGQVLALTPYRRPKEGEKLDLGDEGVLVSYKDAESIPEEDLFYRWARMSKSKGNVVTPEEAVEQYGADALRMYLLFVAPFSADVQWSNDGMQGQVRFLSKIFKLVDDSMTFYYPDWRDVIQFEDGDDLCKSIRRRTHKTIQKATEDIDRFAFNTYVSSLMIYVNDLVDLVKKHGANPSRGFALSLSEAIETLVLLISPGAPHSADELWTVIGQGGFTMNEVWPKFDAKLAADDMVTIAVQVNGKLRDTFEIEITASREELEATAMQSSKAKAHFDGLAIRKVIVIPGKLVNIVAS